jgi:hypothetical protein
MTEKELSQLTDEALLNEAKKLKSTTYINAVLIGFLFGIVIYSVAKNTLGFFALIPILFAFKIFNKPNHKKALEKLLKERNLQ